MVVLSSDFWSRFPSQGETVTTEDGIILTATEVIQNRIEKVTILLPESQEQGDAASSEHSESESSQEASRITVSRLIRSFSYFVTILTQYI